METMYLRRNNFLAMLLIAGFIFVSCKEKESTKLDNYPTPYSIIVPPGFPQPELSKTNPLTVEGISLGKMLYADPILSTNGRSCTSCHQQNYSYSSPLFVSWSGSKISVPPHVNLGFKKQYNWEGSQECLDTLAMGDFEPEFFNTDPELLFQKLKAHTIYPDLFKRSFGVTDISQLSYHELKKKIAMAIGQYLRSRVSANSKFDRFRAKKELLNNMEYEGYVIFYSEKGDCFHCHSEPLYTDQQFHNNGISNDYKGFDLGRYNVSGKEDDKGKFFTPTLRNIELTAPYMHDGRLKTLEEVVDFYNEGVQDNIYVDPLMNKRNGTKMLNLTPLEKAQLVAFLKTLTDTDFIK